MLSKIKTDTAPDTRDTVVIFNDNGTADIARIYDRDHIRIMAQSATNDYSIPLADIKAYASPKGIIYSYPATQENIEDCQRLAELEKSIVLRQITQFEQPLLPDQKTDFKAIFPYILIAILLLIVLVK